VLHIKSKIKKYKIMKNRNYTMTLMAVLFLAVLFPMSSSAQNCSLTLTAKNNIESVNSEGRVYFMVLQNNTSEGIDVSFSTTNNNIGNNPDASDGINNVILNAAILSNNGLALTGNIHLASNETFEFQVKVTVPAGTPVNHWNNTLILASSDKCLNYSTSLNLFTFIPVTE
jgi:hypothetical protein